MELCLSVEKASEAFCKGKISHTISLLHLLLIL